MIEEGLGQYQVPRLKVDQEVLVEPVEYPEEGAIYRVEKIAGEVTLCGPGDVKLNVGIEDLCRGRTDPNGFLRFTPAPLPEIEFDNN